MKIKAHYTALCFTNISNKEKRQTLSLIQNTIRDVLLNKMGKVDSDLCTFCNVIKEDREHLFFYCFGEILKFIGTFIYLQNLHLH